MVTTSRQAVYLPAGRGASAWTPWGDLVIEVLPAALTGGALACVQLETVPGTTRPAYIHHTADEAIHVLSGRFTVTVGDGRDLRGLSLGATVYIPRGVVRAVECEAAGRLLVIQTPGEPLTDLLEVLRTVRPGFAAAALAGCGIELIPSVHVQDGAHPQETRSTA